MKAGEFFIIFNNQKTVTSMRYGIVLMIVFATTSLALAQWKSKLPQMQMKKVQDGTICYHKPEDSNLIIPPPAAYEARNEIHQQKLPQRHLKLLM